MQSSEAPSLVRLERRNATSAGNWIMVPMAFSLVATVLECRAAHGH